MSREIQVTKIEDCHCILNRLSLKQTSGTTPNKHKQNGVKKQITKDWYNRNRVEGIDQCEQFFLKSVKISIDDTLESLSNWKLFSHADFTCIHMAHYWCQLKVIRQGSDDPWRLLKGPLWTLTTSVIDQCARGVLYTKMHSVYQLQGDLGSFQRSLCLQ